MASLFEGYRQGNTASVRIWRWWVLLAWGKVMEALFEFQVWDFTTNNLLGEFDNRAEAEAFIERIKPHGRFGPDGHDLQVIEEEVL